jgi:hypothetical protein
MAECLTTNDSAAVAHELRGVRGVLQVAFKACKESRQPRGAIRLKSPRHLGHRRSESRSEYPAAVPVDRASCWHRTTSDVLNNTQSFDSHTRNHRGMLRSLHVAYCCCSLNCSASCRTSQSISFQATHDRTDPAQSFLMYLHLLQRRTLAGIQS